MITLLWKETRILDRGPSSIWVEMTYLQDIGAQEIVETTLHLQEHNCVILPRCQGYIECCP